MTISLKLKMKNGAVHILDKVSNITVDYSTVSVDYEDDDGCSASDEFQIKNIIKGKIIAED